MDGFTASRAALRKQFLEITQRNPSSCRHLARIKIRIGETVLDDATDAHEQLVRVTRRRRIARCKQRADKIIDCEPHVAIGTRAGYSFFPGIADQIKEKAPDGRSSAPVEVTSRFESEMRNQGLARQKKSHGIPRLPRIAGKKGRAPGDIHEHDIAHIEAHGFFVVGHRWAAGELKERDKVVRAIEANIPVRPLELHRKSRGNGEKPVEAIRYPVSIGTNLSRHEPAVAAGRLSTPPPPPRPRRPGGPPPQRVTASGSILGGSTPPPICRIRSF